MAKAIIGSGTKKAIINGTNNEFIIHSDLVGYWKLDEGSGNIAYDSSVFSNNGTLHGGPTWTTGKIGNALSFDGVDDYVDCGNGKSLSGMSALTIETWVKPNEFPPSLNKRILEKGYTYYLVDTTAKKAQLLLYTTGGYDYVTADSPLLDTAKWYHIVGVYDGTNIMIYIDGIKVATKTHIYGGLPVATNSSPLILGSVNGISNYFNGLIDEVRIYNRALSADEILQHYQAGL